MGKNTIVVMTADGPARILKLGGSQSWVLKQENAEKRTYIVMVQNRHNGQWGGATEPHGMAFMIGKVSEVVPAKGDDSKQRYMVRISEYARIKVPQIWRGSNPVRYVSLEELGINIEEVKFLPMPAIDGLSNGIDDVNDGVDAMHLESIHTADAAVLAKPLTIPEAKAGLAATLGVRIDQIEITISA